MPCGACGKNKPPSSQTPAKTCPKCKYPARLIHQYSTKMRRQESVWVCQNMRCKNVIR